MSTDRDPTELPAELSEIEAALGSLAPAKGRLDRDRLMYRAGQSSIRTDRAGRRGWIAASLIGLVAIGEGAMLARRPAERIVERVVVVREPAPTPAVLPVQIVESTLPTPRPPEVGPAARDRLAWQVLRYGLDGLPASGPWGGGDPSASRQSLREEIDKALNLGDPS